MGAFTALYPSGSTSKHIHPSSREHEGRVTKRVRHIQVTMKKRFVFLQRDDGTSPVINHQPSGVAGAPVTCEAVVSVCSV